MIHSAIATGLITSCRVQAAADGPNMVGGVPMPRLSVHSASVRAAISRALRSASATTAFMLSLIGLICVLHGAGGDGELGLVGTCDRLCCDGHASEVGSQDDRLHPGQTCRLADRVEGGEHVGVGKRTRR